MTSVLNAAPAQTPIKVFDQEPDKDFTGKAPAFFEHIAKLPDGSIAGCVKLLNPTSLKSKSLTDLLKCGQMACVVYDHGMAKMVSLNHAWVEHLIKHNVSKIILSTGGESFFIKEDVDVEDLTKESYMDMVKLCVPLLKV